MAGCVGAATLVTFDELPVSRSASQAMNATASAIPITPVAVGRGYLKPSLPVSLLRSSVAGDRRGRAAGQPVVELWPTGRTSPETATERDVAGTGS